MEYLILQIPVENILDDKDSQYLFDKYAEEAKHEDVQTNNTPDKAKYMSLQEMGMLDCVGVYYDKNLVGFIVALTMNMTHYNELHTTIESQFLLKEHRHNGVGIKMFRKLEHIVQAKGSRHLFMSAPIGSRLEKIATKLYGFKPTSTLFLKTLKG